MLRIEKEKKRKKKIRNELSQKAVHDKDNHSSTREDQ